MTDQEGIFNSGPRAFQNPILDRDDEIYNNEAPAGGACVIAGTGVDVLFESNLVYGNIASRTGGGVYISWDATARIQNCTIVRNKSFGTAHQEDGGGGINCLRGVAFITNTILWGNEVAAGAKELAVYYSWNPSSADVDYCDIEGGMNSVYVETGCTLNWGAGNIDADPKFADFDNGDYHLTWPSPCRNAGDNSVYSQPGNDFEGDPRISQMNIDIGADEFYYHLYSIGSSVVGLSSDIRIVGHPGAPALLALGSGIQDPPLSTPFGDFHLALPLRKQIQLGFIDYSGVKRLTANILSGVQAGTKFPFQAMVGKIGGVSTTLTNLLQIKVETYPADYRRDDGSVEDMIGLRLGGDFCWMHRYEVMSGAETIVNVQQIFGSAQFPGVSPGNGSPCEFFVWDDPTNDGDPSDCALLTRQPSTVQVVDQDEVVVVPLSVPVTVSGHFYVGCVMPHAAGQYCGSLDSSSVCPPDYSFYCGTDTIGGFDPINLMNNQYQPTDLRTFFCIRAGY